MQKAFRDIVERLEECTIKNKDSLAFFNECGIKFVSTNKAIEIVNQVAEEYKTECNSIRLNDEACEWKKDKIMSGMYVTCSGYVTYIKDFKYCPYCGKKIKVVK